MTRKIMTKRNLGQARQSGQGCNFFSGFCVTRYARGAVGITQFRAACDRDYTQENDPLAETFLFKMMAPEHRGLSSGRRLHKRGHCVGQGNLVTQAREKPQAFRWFQARRDGGENSQKTGTDNPRRNITVARGSRSTLDRVPNAPSRERRKKHLTPAQPRHQFTKTRQTRNQAVQVTVLLRRHYQHKLKVEFHSTRILSNRPFPEVNSRKLQGRKFQQCPHRLFDRRRPRSSAQVEFADQASSWTQDAGRVSSSRAAARRRLADGQSKFDGGWSHDSWN